MALTTFVSGQILTAAQMNAVQANDYNQTVTTKTADYVLVAADKGTRIVMNSGSATTITVNTSLFSAGDTLFLQNIGAGVCTVTAGTATVSSAGPLAIPQNGSGLLYFTSAGVSIFYPSAVTATAGALTLISATTIGTTVSSVTVSNAFSATYDNYLITVSGGVGSGDVSFVMTLGSTTANYYWAGFAMNYNSTTVGGENGDNVANWTNIIRISANSINGAVYLYEPNAAKRTHFSSNGSRSSTGGNFNQFSGFLDNDTQYTAFTLTTGSGTATGGTIRVYGLANS